MKAVIDRIEGDLAIVLVGDKGELKLNIPLSFLPSGCRESDVLMISIERDPVVTEQTKARVSGLMEKLKTKGQSRVIKGQE